MTSDRSSSAWPYYQSPTDVKASGRQLVLKADEQERAAIARLGGLLGLESFHADLEVMPIRKGKQLQVTGRWHAELIYESVRTLEPVPRQLKGKVSELFYATPDQGSNTEDTDLDLPFEIGAEGVPIGDLLVELLVAKLDPYPHGDDEDLVVYIEDDNEVTDLGTHRPFAGLGKLTSKGETRG